MNVLVACEWSGTVARAFKQRGHNAWSCDMELSDYEDHIVGNVLEVAHDPYMVWDLMIGFPPCTYLCSSGLHWNVGNPERQRKTEEAFEFFMELWDAPIERVCLENPVGCISSKFRPPDQYIHPHQFGHDASKKTGLWLRGLPKLSPTQSVPPRWVDGKPRWGNQTDSGQNRLGPSEARARIRGKTFEGIAEAMAEQWSNI